MTATPRLRAAISALALTLTAIPIATHAAAAPPAAGAAGPVVTAPSREDEAQTARQIDAFSNDAPPFIDAPASTDAAESPWRHGLYTAVSPGAGAVDAMNDVAVDAAAAPRQMHGEVSASVGTHGLRAGSAAVVLPIGEDATLGLAVSSAHFGR